MTDAQQEPLWIPGPWVRSYHGFQVLTRNGEISICQLSPGQSRDVQVATATLIASAPDMFVELTRLRQENEALKAELIEVSGASVAFQERIADLEAQTGAPQ